MTSRRWLLLGLEITRTNNVEEGPVKRGRSWANKNTFKIHKSQTQKCLMLDLRKVTAVGGIISEFQYINCLTFSKDETEFTVESSKCLNE